jgi:ATP-binding cassette subfamily G (WHITE) protein 2 (PDR)
VFSVLVPLKDLLKFWHFVYRASPLTYFIDGMVVAENTAIKCADIEILHINPPARKTCGDYLSDWISTAGGYLKYPTTRHDYEYFPVSDTNILLSNTGITVGDRWHNFAYLTVYVVFNVFATFFIYHIVRERKSKSSK